MVAQGATTIDLGKTYLTLVRQQFGKGMRVPQEFQWEWLTIPHIYASPFYCYAYSFGNLLVLALYTDVPESRAADSSRNIWICWQPAVLGRRRRFWLRWASI